MKKLEAQQGLLADEPEGMDIGGLLETVVRGVKRGGGLLGELVNPAELQAPTFIHGPERERNFQNWFGDSVAVDKAGKPLELYHGTVSDFDAFDNSKLESRTPSVASAIGHFFTSNPRVADRFAGASIMQRVMGKTEPGNTVPVNLRLQNPVVFESSFSDPQYTQAHLDKRYKDAYRALHKELGMDNVGLNQSFESQVERAKRWRDSMIEKGHDGVILRNTIRDAEADTDPSDHYIIFEPEQAKGIYNRGTYNPEDPDLLGMLRRGARNTIRG